MTDHVQPSLHNESQPQPPAGRFAYAPLDHRKASIRLIRVLATRTQEGYIQCKIRHAFVDDSYVCLSYVWGEPGDEHYIMVNDRIMRVRCNLHSFLDAATRKDRLRGQWLWIDALCIDQTNVGERNHQVQQMGLVFSSAEEVMSWLGDSAEISAYLQWVGQKHGEKDATPVADNRLELGTMERKGRHRFRYSEYWTRAWITQEVVLAKRVTLCAGDAEWDFASLPQHEHYPAEITRLLPSATAQLHGRSIIFLINQFASKKSQLCQDVIYSLLSLSGDGSDLQVDYDSPLSTLQPHVLRNCERSFCLCSVYVVDNVLQLSRYQDFSTLNSMQRVFKHGTPALTTYPQIRTHPETTIEAVPGTIREQVVRACNHLDLYSIPLLCSDSTKSENEERSKPSSRFHLASVIKKQTTLSPFKYELLWKRAISKPMAYVTLPFFRGRIRLDKGDARLLQSEADDVPHWNWPYEVSFAQQLPGEEKVSVFINYGRVCKAMNHSVHKIVFMIKDGAKTVHLGDDECSDELYECLLVLSSNTCSVLFTHNHLRSIASRYGGSNKTMYPCDRINFQGTELVSSLDEPVLRLYSEDSFTAACVDEL